MSNIKKPAGVEDPQQAECKREKTYRNKVIKTVEGMLSHALTKYQEDKTDKAEQKVAAAEKTAFEKRKFGVDKAAVIGAYIAAGLLFAQDVILRMTLVDARETADTAHKDTRDALRIARQAGERQARAYLYASPIPTTLNVMGIVTGGIYVRSAGSTPAYKVHGWIMGAVAKYPLPSAIDLDSFLQSKETRTATIVFGDNILFLPLGKDEPLALEVQQMIATGDKYRFYTFGRIDYEDAFHAPHWTTYCFVWWGDKLNSTLGMYVACSTHNETDADKDDNPK